MSCYHFCCFLFLRYLDGVHFVLNTDHDAQKWLFVTSSTSGKLARWRLRLHEFSFNVVHVPGPKNRAADGMSKLETYVIDNRKQPVHIEVPTLAIETDVNPPTFEDAQIGLSYDVLAVHHDAVEPFSLDDIRIAQAEDLECQN